MTSSLITTIIVAYFVGLVLSYIISIFIDLGYATSTREDAAKVILWPLTIVIYILLAVIWLLKHIVDVVFYGFWLFLKSIPKIIKDLWLS